MNKAILLISALNFILYFDAQAQISKAAGLVSFNDARQSGVVIKNMNTGTQAISNDQGEFTIAAKPGDSLIIYKEDYKRDTLVVANQPWLIIQLKHNPLMLKEVVVSSTAATPLKTFEENKKDYKEIYRIGDKSNIIGPDNIDKIWSAVSKEGNDARRLQRTFNSDYRNGVINRRFNKTLVTRITGYKGDRLLNFMNKYRPTFEMAVSAKEYEMTEYIKRKLAQDKDQLIP
jgi:hypothetical protein